MNETTASLYSAYMTPHALLPIVKVIDAFVVPDGRLYLDCAAHGPPLRSVRAAAVAALHDGSTHWFGSHWRERVERVRALAAQLFDGDANAVALVPIVALSPDDRKAVAGYFSELPIP